MKDASNIMEFVDVDVPVSTAYDQWTQFEEFPRFMSDIEVVRQVDDTTLEWKARIGGVTKEWTARITEQTPDARIAWSSTTGAHNAGVVTFHRLTDTSCASRSRSTTSPKGWWRPLGICWAWCREAPRLTSKSSRSSSKGVARRRGPFGERSPHPRRSTANRWRRGRRVSRPRRMRLQEAWILLILNLMVE
jgi:Polyketide cyclase / dehydrase and lipid transport